MKNNLKPLLATLLVGTVLFFGFASAQSSTEVEDTGTQQVQVDTQALSTTSGSVMDFLNRQVNTNVPADAPCFDTNYALPSNTTVTTPETYTCLVRALKATGLDKSLAGSGPFTVFAPSDEAFQQFASTMPQSEWEALFKDSAKLKQLLSYHVLPMKRTLANLSVEANASGDYNTKTLEGSELFLNFAGDGSSNTVITLANEESMASSNVSHVSGETTEASNGTIIPVNQVLRVPTL
jgi:uncharacterized surface protein with fasciclin (FAS1) repeats